MFVGHFAPALAAKALAGPSAPSLAVLFVAAQLVDWVFFGLLMAGVERLRIVPGLTPLNEFQLQHMPWTHSLLGSAVWAAAFGALVAATTANSPGRAAYAGRAGAVTAAVTLSHWFLDLLVHVPDLTLAGSPPKLGLGLWRHPTIEIPLEIGLTVGTLLLYAQSSSGRAGHRHRPVVLGALLLLLQAVDWFGSKPVPASGADTDPIPLALLAWAGYGVATGVAAWASAPAGRKRT